MTARDEKVQGKAGRKMSTARTFPVTVLAEGRKSEEIKELKCQEYFLKHWR